MIVGERTQLVFFLRKKLLDKLLESRVELGIVAAGIGQQEAALLDVLAKVLPGHGIELGSPVAIEEDDGRLQEVGDRGDGGIDDLPGEQAFPVV